MNSRKCIKNTLESKNCMYKDGEKCYCLPNYYDKNGKCVKSSVYEFSFFENEFW